MSDTNKSNQEIARRKLLKSIAAGGGAAGFTMDRFD